MSFVAKAGSDEARVWHLLLKALTRVGSELFFEVQPDQLILRALNASRSAFATIRLPASFFNTFRVTGEVEKCKILLKSAAAIFKNALVLDHFEIQFDCAKSDLSFSLRCRNGMSKHYHLVYEQCDVLQAVYDKENCPNRARLNAKPLLDCLSSFHSSVEEVTMQATRKALHWKSYVAAEEKEKPDMQTETSFNAQELDKFQVRGEPSVTFSIRELKAIVAFCDSIACEMSFHFDEPGSPMIFSAEHADQALFLDLVLATLQDVSGSLPSQFSTGEPTGGGENEDREGWQGGTASRQSATAARDHGRQSQERSEAGGESQDRTEAGGESQFDDSILSAATSDPVTSRQQSQHVLSQQRASSSRSAFRGRNSQSSPRGSAQFAEDSLGAEDSLAAEARGSLHADDTNADGREGGDAEMADAGGGEDGGGDGDGDGDGSAQLSGRKRQLSQSSDDDEFVAATPSPPSSQAPR